MSILNSLNKMKISMNDNTNLNNNKNNNIHNFNNQRIYTETSENQDISKIDSKNNTNNISSKTKNSNNNKFNKKKLKLKLYNGSQLNIMRNALDLNLANNTRNLENIFSDENYKKIQPLLNRNKYTVVEKPKVVEYKKYEPPKQTTYDNKYDITKVKLSVKESLNELIDNIKKETCLSSPMMEVKQKRLLDNNKNKENFSLIVQKANDSLGFHSKQESSLKDSVRGSIINRDSVNNSKRDSFILPTIKSYETVQKKTKKQPYSNNIKYNNNNFSPLKNRASVINSPFNLNTDYTKILNINESNSSIKGNIIRKKIDYFSNIKSNKSLEEKLAEFKGEIDQYEINQLIETTKKEKLQELKMNKIKSSFLQNNNNKNNKDKIQIDYSKRFNTDIKSNYETDNYKQAQYNLDEATKMVKSVSEIKESDIEKEQKLFIDYINSIKYNNYYKDKKSS